MHLGNSGASGPIFIFYILNFSRFLNSLEKDLVPMLFDVQNFNLIAAAYLVRTLIQFFSLIFA